MLKNKNWWFMPAMVFIMLAFSAVLYPNLPEEMPMKWSFSGEVLSMAPKWQVVLVMPLVGAGLWLVTYVVPLIDPRRKNYEKFEATYIRLRQGMIVFMAGLHMLLLTHYDDPSAMTKLILFVCALALAYFGNEAGRIRQTWFFGIRTPWTLADERVWDKTHRVGGRWLFAAGIVNMLAVLALPFTIAIIWFVATALAVSLGVTAYSYVVYQRLNA